MPRKRIISFTARKNPKLLKAMAEQAHQAAAPGRRKVSLLAAVEISNAKHGLPQPETPDETIRILNGWQLTREATGWRLHHPAKPDSPGFNIHLARVLEIDAHGVWAQDRNLREVRYLTLFCASHERVAADAGSEPGSHVLGSGPHCKWCGELWERIEARAGGSAGN